jgi:YggT family protein
MFVFANLLFAMAQVLDYVLWAYIWILIGRVVVSFVNADYDNPLVRFLHAATEPILERVRERFPMVAGTFDFSPIVVWIAIIFLRRFLVQSLYDLSSALR